MVANEKLYKTCPECSGLGFLTRRNYSTDSNEETTETVCPNCNGDKVMLWGESENSTALNDVVDTCNNVADKCNDVVKACDDILDTCNDILDKCNDIFEKLNQQGHGGNNG